MITTVMYLAVLEARGVWGTFGWIQGNCEMFDMRTMIVKSLLYTKIGDINVHTLCAEVPVHHMVRILVITIEDRTEDVP